MTTIKIIETGKTEELQLLNNGIDFLSDVIGGLDESKRGEDTDWEMTQDEFDWWERWAEREQRINDTAEDMGEDAINKLCELAGIFGHDMELLQDKSEEYLGIEAM